MSAPPTGTVYNNNAPAYTSSGAFEQGEIDGIPADISIPSPLEIAWGGIDSCGSADCGLEASGFAGSGGNPATQIKSLYQNILEHVEKISADPESQVVSHWKKEIANWTKQIMEKAGKRRGDVDKYLQRVIGISGKELENILGSPIIVVNPCVTNPIAPYCNRGSGPVLRGL